jgi:AcrR family transcriptional regulator
MATRQIQEKPVTRMSGEDRRQQIIEVAIRLFSQKGFRGTTTREIALAAGVNEAIIFRHFVTKQELYSAIIDQMFGSDELQALHAEIAEAMERRDDRRIFESIAQHILDFHDRDDSLMRLIFYSALEGHELCDIFYRNQASRRHQLIADYIRTRITEGAFRRVDPLTAARAFFGMVLYHAQINALYRRDRVALGMALTNRQAAERFADLILGALARPENDAARANLRRITKKKN